MDSGRVEESIKHSIVKNGFPERKVQLPFKPIYECCKQNGSSLSQVLENLSAENIFGKIKGDHIEFRSSLETGHSESDTAGNQNGTGTADWSDLQKSAMAAMAQMTPGQIADLRRMAENLSEEDKKNILETLGRQPKPSA